MLYSVMTTLFGGRDCYKGVTDGFPLLFFHKNGPFVRCRETADTAQRDAVLCTAKTRKEGIYDEQSYETGAEDAAPDGGGSEAA